MILLPPPSMDALLSTMLIVVLPFGRLTLVVVIVPAIAAPADRPNRIETLRAVFTAIPVIFAMIDFLRTQNLNRVRHRKKCRKRARSINHLNYLQFTTH